MTFAHEIEIDQETGRACIAWAGEKPYHKLGFQVDSDMTPGQMMAAAGVDWGVELHSVFSELTVGGKVKRVNVTAQLGTKVLVRDTDRKPLTVTGSGWHPIQNAQAFETFTDFVEKAKLEMHTAGSLKGGSIVWALAKGRNGFSLFRGKDKIETHVLFSNPHMYGKSAAVMLTPMRVVSATTLAIPLRGPAGKLSSRIAHRKPFQAEEVARLLEVFEKQLSTYKEQAEYLTTKRLEKGAFLEFLTRVFPGKSEDKPSRQAEIAAAVLETQPGAEFGAGTWWAAYCAVAFTIDHLLGKPLKGEEDDMGMRDRRLDSAWFGHLQRRKSAALDLAIEFAKKARTA